MKKVFSFVIAAFIISLCIAVYTLNSNKEVYSTTAKSNAISTDKIPIKPYKATFAIDANNPDAVVGNVDNTFIGYVTKKGDTVYKNEGTLETKDGTKKIGSPYTNYKIIVIDNLKGKLKKNNDIPVQKDGGLNINGDAYFLYENDVLPEEGKYYIFNTYNQPDGSILISGPNSNIELNVSSKSEIMKATEYKEYIKHVKNQSKIERKRFSSKYDE